MRALMSFFLILFAANSVNATLISQTAEFDLSRSEIFKFDNDYRETTLNIESFDQNLGELTSVEVILFNHYAGVHASTRWYTVDGSETSAIPGEIFAIGTGTIFLNDIKISARGGAVGGVCVMSWTNQPVSGGVCSDGEADGVNNAVTSITTDLSRFISPNPVQLLFATELSYWDFAYDSELVQFSDPEISLYHEGSMVINYHYDAVDVSEPGSALLLLLSLIGLGGYRKRMALSR